MKWKYLTFMGLIVALIAIVRQPTAGQETAVPLFAEVTLTDFSDGTSENLTQTADGLMLSSNAFSGSYLSAIIEAPQPFNVMVPEWTAVSSPTAELHLLVRTGTADGRWQEWTAVHAHADWDEADNHTHQGDFILVPEADGTHDRIQFAINFSRENTLVNPTLNSLNFALIDSTKGPTTAELQARQAELNAAQPETGAATTMTNPRPDAISRSVWCTYDECNYDAANNTYADATHMIVHHTVSGNHDYADWAPIVNAIWYYHAINLEWGDIGYNYLIDQNGIVYEGYNSVDYLNEDVKGIHAREANVGSMGVGLIGNFTDPEDYPQYNPPGMAPPQPMLNSLVALLSWKAEQRDINVFESGDTLPDVDYGLPHLMGHRNVYGDTECPGDQVFRLIPSLRQQVAANLDLVDPYTYVSEESTAFTKSDANWYLGNNECGHNGHVYQTWSTTDPALSTNWGEWQIDVPVDGVYQLQAFVPFCKTGRAETAGAPYTVSHLNGSDDLIVSQQENLGLWTDLGEYEMLASGDNSLYLNDLVTTDDGLGMWFDDIRFLKVDEIVTVTNQAPAADTWLNTRDITFTWAITSPTAIQTTTLTVADNTALTNPIITQTWASKTITYTHTFTQDYEALTWQATAVTSSTTPTSAGSTPTVFGIDTITPTAAIDAIYRLRGGSYLLTWSGTDDNAGVATYSLEYQAVVSPSQSIDTAQSADWTPWLTDTTAIAGSFTPPDADATYAFRIRATDRAGNQEAPPTNPDIDTSQALDLPYAIMLPSIYK